MCRAVWRHRGAGPSGWGRGGAERLLLEEAVLELDGYVVVSARKGAERGERKGIPRRIDNRRGGAGALESRAFSVDCGVAQSGCSLRVFRRGGVREALDGENNQVLGATYFVQLVVRAMNRLTAQNGLLGSSLEPELNLGGTWWAVAMRFQARSGGVSTRAVGLGQRDRHQRDFGGRA